MELLGVFELRGRNLPYFSVVVASVGLPYRATTINYKKHVITKKGTIVETQGRV